MKLVLFSPWYFEKLHGHSNSVEDYFNFVRKLFDPEEISPVIRSVEVLFFIAPKSEFEAGKFEEFMGFKWTYGVATIAVRGDYETYLHSDESEKVDMIYHMLLDASARLKKKRKAKCDVPKMERLINTAYQQYMDDARDRGNGSIP